ncbi:MAG TPA: cytochrome P450 [Gemmataceae bacterium]|nr:cytochrome P450 [Gemmataceae bacterium]
MARAIHSLPPGPKSPAAWQLLRYSYSPLSFLEECSRRFGDPFTVRWAGYGKFVMLADPQAVKDVFRGDAHALHSGERNEFLAASVGKNSVLVLDDEPHARQRRVLLPPLKGERMRSFFGAMQSAALEEMHAWPLGGTMGMLAPMQQITLRVMLQVVLGLSPGPELDGFAVRVERVLALGRGRYGLIFVKVLPIAMLQRTRWLPFYRRMHELDEALFAFMERQGRRPTEVRGESILADLLAASHEDGRPLSRQEVRDALVTLIFAGHDTTSVALAWALEQIVPRPDVVERIADELERTTSGRLPAADQLSGLQFLDAAIRESLRIRTILPFAVRLAKAAFMAGGRAYPPGVVLCPCSHLVHRRDDLYPEPARFRPERFLEKHYAAHEWFPFGGGGRMCLGMAFALYEMKVVLSTLFATVRLARPPDSRSAPIRRGLALAPDDEAKMTVVERRT